MLHFHKTRSQKKNILFMHKFLANARNPINSFSSHSESHESGPNIIVKLTCENYRGNLFFFLFAFQGLCLQVL